MAIILVGIAATLVVFGIIFVSTATTLTVIFGFTVLCSGLIYLILRVEENTISSRL